MGLNLLVCLTNDRLLDRAQSQAVTTRRPRHSGPSHGRHWRLAWRLIERLQRQQRALQPSDHSDRSRAIRGKVAAIHRSQHPAEQVGGLLALGPGEGHGSIVTLALAACSGDSPEPPTPAS